MCLEWTQSEVILNVHQTCHLFECSSSPTIVDEGTEVELSSMAFCLYLKHYKFGAWHSIEDSHRTGLVALIAIGSCLARYKNFLLFLLVRCWQVSYDRRSTQMFRTWLYQKIQWTCVTKQNPNGPVTTPLVMPNSVLKQRNLQVNWNMFAWDSWW